MFLPSLAFLFGWASLLAKMQSIPMFFLLDTAIVVGVLIQPKLQLRKSAVRSVLLALAVAALGLLIISFRFGRFDLIGGPEPFLVIASTALGPAFIFILNQNSPTLRASSAFVALLVSILLVLVSLAVLPGWLDLLLKPSTAFQYVGNPSSCSSLLCRAGLGLEGIRVLFERSIDSYMLALLGAFLSLVLLACTVIQARYSFVRGACSGRSWSLLAAAVWCYFIAIFMAMLGAQRYAVDDYLNYQQPFIILSMAICVLITRGRLRFCWQIFIFTVLLSLMLIFGRYSSVSLRTFVTNAGPVKEGELMRGSARDSLCADQHKGSVWDGSSLAPYCGWK
jgi:hypothetical protein